MMSQTKTEFKPKSCPKCNRNHSQDGVLCEFCRKAAENNRNKVQVAPEHSWIECKIERDGDTELNIGLVRYVFRRNQHGHAVCQIINHGHYNQILKSSLYVPYDFREPEEAEPKKKIKTEMFSEADALIVTTLAAEGKKSTEIAAALNEDGREQQVTYQRVGKFLGMIKEA